MSQERQYQILGRDGSVCGAVWADEIKNRDNPCDGFWFLRSGQAIASSWFGYIDHLNDKKVLPPSANAEKPVDEETVDGSAKP